MVMVLVFTYFITKKQSFNEKLFCESLINLIS